MNINYYVTHSKVSLASKIEKNHVLRLLQTTHKHKYEDGLIGLSCTGSTLSTLVVILLVCHLELQLINSKIIALQLWIFVGSSRKLSSASKVGNMKKARK